MAGKLLSFCFVYASFISLLPKTEHSFHIHVPIEQRIYVDEGDLEGFNLSVL